jgi:hypothetical protein
MPAVQTTYNATMPAYTLGQVSRSEFSNTITRECEDAAGIAFGLPVIQGTADHQAKVGASGVFLGITVRDVTLDSTRSDKYAQYDSMAIVTQGVVAVLAGENVAAGDAVYRTSTGALNKTSSGNTLIAGARWETTTASGAVGLVRLS